MKRFLRYSTSGYIAIIYSVLVALPLIDLSAVPTKSEASVVHVAIIALVGAGGIPLGFIMHEISVAFLGPLRNVRFGMHRALYTRLVKGNTSASDPADHDVQGVLEDAKSRVLALSEKSHDWQHVIDELSGRCNYYYARIESAILSPIVAAMFLLYAYALAAVNDAEQVLAVSSVRVCASVITVLAIIAVSILLLVYIPRLVREIDALELKIYEESVQEDN